MLIECDQIRYRYPGAADWTLSGVDCVVRGGESIAITGPSGSGKTTLLSIMGLLLESTNGAVSYDGVIVNPGSSIAHQTGVAWIFQTNSILGSRSVLDNVALGAFCRGLQLEASYDTALAALDRVGMRDLTGRRAQSLSGGELQRLAVARSLTRAPDVLFADEPTSNLDQRNSSMVASALLAHLESGTSVVIATHDESVARSCHRILTLTSGSLLESVNRETPQQ